MESISQLVSETLAPTAEAITQAVESHVNQLVEAKTAEADARIKEATDAAQRLNDRYTQLHEATDGDATKNANELARRTADLDAREAAIKPREDKVAQQEAKLVERARQVAALRTKYEQGVAANQTKAEQLKTVAEQLKASK